jgi:hypothetical protein|tara:strand:- start:3770 stop:3883 length:114 start_codon:yes stop_codon:yes gene_type:complete
MSFSYLIYQFGGHGGYEIATVAFLISVALAVITLRIK